VISGEGDALVLSEFLQDLCDSAPMSRRVLGNGLGDSAEMHDLRGGLQSKRGVQNAQEVLSDSRVLPFKNLGMPDAAGETSQRDSALRCSSRKEA